MALAAGRGETVRVAPFEEIEIDVGGLFGDDEKVETPSEEPR